MENRTRKKDNKHLLGEIVVVLIIILVVISLIVLNKINKINKDIANLEIEYNNSKEHADAKLKEDKEKWNEIDEKSTIIIDPETEEPDVDPLADYVDPMILRDELKNEASPEFKEAIEWAEEQNRNNIDSKYSPFDKEGFVDSYYKNANEIKEHIQNHEDAVKTIEIKREKLNLAIMLLITELGVLVLREFVNDKSKLSILSIILIVFSIVLIIMGI